MPFNKTFTPDFDRVVKSCRKPLHPAAEEGIRLYNNGKYFVAHEAFENAWNAEEEPDRRLYQGMLQAGIVFMHARNGYAKGVYSMYDRCRVWLGPWPDHCRTVNVGKLRADVKAVVRTVNQLGPDNLDKLDPNLFTQIERV